MAFLFKPQEKQTREGKGHTIPRRENILEGESRWKAERQGIVPVAKKGPRDAFLHWMEQGSTKRLDNG